MLPNNIDVSFHTHVGKVRANNEDSVYINRESKILMIADGMGGHNGGEIASKLAVEIVSKYLTSLIENNILKKIEIDANVDLIFNITKVTTNNYYFESFSIEYNETLKDILERLGITHSIKNYNNNLSLELSELNQINSLVVYNLI